MLVAERIPSTAAANPARNMTARPRQSIRNQSVPLCSTLAASEFAVMLPTVTTSTATLRPWPASSQIISSASGYTAEVIQSCFVCPVICMTISCTPRWEVTTMFR
jgi:hypothetical protein